MPIHRMLGGRWGLPHPGHTVGETWKLRVDDS